FLQKFIGARQPPLLLLHLRCKERKTVLPVATIKQTETFEKTLPSVTEAELIAGCQRAESKAQKLLYERFASQMYGVCLRYLKAEMDAEEALLNGFMKIYQNIG